MKKIALLFLPSLFFVSLCAFGSIQIYSAGAHAQPAVADAGVGSGSSMVVIPPPPDAIPAPVAAGSGSQMPKPSDSIDNPIEKPAEAFDDLKAAKKIGWTPLVFAVLVMLSLVASKLGGKFEFLGNGKMPVIVGAGGAIGAAGFDTVMLGGTWVAIFSAIVVALAAAWTPKKPAG